MSTGIEQARMNEVDRLQSELSALKRENEQLQQMRLDHGHDANRLIGEKMAAHEERDALKQALQRARPAIEAGISAMQDKSTSFAYRDDDISGKYHNIVCDCRDHSDQLRGLLSLSEP